MEPEVKPVVTQQQSAPAVTDPQKPAPGNPAPAPASKGESKPDRTFTRDEVTTILKKRFDRFSAGFYKKYGVKDSKELDEIWNKRKNYDDIVTERDGLKTSNAEMVERLAFLSNGIDPDRYDDIRTYFKGKGTAFDEAVLKEHLATHPEWVKQVAAQKPAITIEKVGGPQAGPKAETDDARRKRVFGL